MHGFRIPKVQDPELHTLCVKEKEKQPPDIP